MGWLYILYTVFLLLVLLFIVGEKSNRRSKALWGYVLTYVVSFFYYRTFSVYGLIGLNFIYLGDTNGIISTVMLFLPLLYVVCMIPRIWKTLRAADQAYVAEEQRKRDRAFYEECKKFGIHRVSDLKKPENQQRFRLLAAKHKMEKLTEKELEDLLDRCAAAYREEKAAEAAEKKRQGQAAEELFARLAFGEPTVKVSQFGSVTVQVSVKADKDLTIFDKLPAFIDGSITAEIYDGEEKIGEAVLVFPAFGSMTYRLEEERYRDGYVSVKGLRTERGRSVKLEGMCLGCGKKGKEYTVKLVPRDLWAMER